MQNQGGHQMMVSFVVSLSGCLVGHRVTFIAHWKPYKCFSKSLVAVLKIQMCVYQKHMKLIVYCFVALGNFSYVGIYCQCRDIFSLLFFIFSCGQIFNMQIGPLCSLPLPKKARNLTHYPRNRGR